MVRESATTTDSSTEEEEEEGEEEEGPHGREEAQAVEEDDDREGWIEWLRRTAEVVHGYTIEGKVVDWVVEQRRRKWRWAGHVARRKDGRWTRWMLDWQPLRGIRAPGRPVTRWEDSLVNFMRGRGQSWVQLAEDRDAWAALEDEYVKAGF